MASGTGKNQSWQKKAAKLAENKAAISNIAKSGEAQKLMELLRQQGGTEAAAKQAADGNPWKLMKMIQQLAQTPEGAKLVQNIGSQARNAGLK